MRRAEIGTSVLFAGGLLLLGISGCGSDPAHMSGTGGAGGAIADRKVEIFSWWIAPGEAEALQALVDVNKVAYPHDRIFNQAAVSGDGARAELVTRFSAGNQVPDLFQQNAADLPAFAAANPNRLEDLTAFFAEKGLNNATTGVFPDLLKNVKVGTQILAMPVNVHRENALFYNKQIFTAKGITPPTSWADFLTACAALKTAGVTPIATGSQGWILRIMFNSIAMGSMGSAKFETFMTTTGSVAAQATDFKAAIDAFANVLNNYVQITDGFVADVGWTQAADLVHSGGAAMFFHGDWAKGYYVQLGWTPGVDFGVVGAPGAATTFWYGMDTFSLPVGALQKDGAMDFLTTIGSDKGQTEFNKLKGSSPVLQNITMANLDAEGRKTFDDLRTSTSRLAVVGKNAYDDAALAFAKSARDDAAKLAFYNVYLTSPPKM